MRTYNEIKSIVDAQSELEILSKPAGITSYEWSFYLQMDRLQNEKQVLENKLFDINRAIESLNALNGIY